MRFSLAILLLIGIGDSSMSGSLGIRFAKAGERGSQSQIANSVNVGEIHSSVQGPELPEPLQEILAKMREAMFGGKQVSAMVVTGTTNQYDSRAKFKITQSKQGHYLREFNGTLTWTDGFDDKHTWQRGWTGDVRLVQFADRDRSHSVALLQFGGWLANPSWFHLELDKDQSSESVVSIKARLPDSKKVCVLKVNKKDYLLQSIQIPEGERFDQVTFKEYAKHSGLTIPMLTEFQLGDETYQQKVDQVESADPAVSFAKPATDMSTVKFIGESRSLRIKRAKTGHVLVNLDVAGFGNCWFILDTGAGGTVFDKRVIRAAKPKELGRITMVSILGVEKSPVVKIGSLDFGPIKINDVQGMEMDLSFTDVMMGESICGIVGYDLFSKCVCEIRLNDETVNVYQSSKFNSDSVQWKSLQLDGRLPLIPCQLNDFESDLYRIDIGASGLFFSNVVFHTPYAKKHKLVDKFGKEDFMLPGQPFKTGTVERFLIAGKVFKNPQVGFALSDKPPFNELYSCGNVGVEFLKPFRIVLDYPQHRYSIKVDE